MKLWFVLLRGQCAAAGGPGGHQPGPAADAGVRPRLRIPGSSQHQHGQRGQHHPQADRKCVVLQVDLDLDPGPGPGPDPEPEPDPRLSANAR